MNWYVVAKHLHVACVALSIVGFIARYMLATRGSALVRHPLARIVPHVNDTLLLAAAIAMLFIANIDPLALAWLRAKIVGLAAYIVLGMLALRRGRSARIRMVAFVGAVLTFGFVVIVAITKSPFGPAAL